jgi:hypothetical protein
MFGDQIGGGFRVKRLEDAPGRKGSGGLMTGVSTYDAWESAGIWLALG